MVDVLRHLKVPSSIDRNPGSEPPGIFLRWRLPKAGRHPEQIERAGMSAPQVFKGGFSEMGLAPRDSVEEVLHPNQIEIAKKRWYPGAQGIR